MSGNWRVDKTVSDLSSLGITEETPEAQQQAWQDAGLLLPGQSGSFEHVARITYENGQALTFFHEPITRFMERVALGCPSE